MNGEKPEDKRQDVTRQVISTFKTLLAEGSLVSGQRLPAERDLAKSLSVSRSSLRQALKVLEIMNVISQRVGDGTYLNRSAASILGEPVEFLILLDGITFHELMEARLIVEPELTARAASRATEEDLTALRRTLTAMEGSRDDRERFIEQDLLFHQTIFRLAGNRMCSLMFSVIHQSLHKMIELTSQLVRADHTLHLHRRIYSAVRRREPEQSRARMVEHLLDAQGLLTRAHEQLLQSRLQDRLGRVAPPAGAKRLGARPGKQC
jgi:GntR family transcriptional repressor for pyruvate dehydrogenase complex